MEKFEGLLLGTATQIFHEKSLDGDNFEPVYEDEDKVTEYKTYIYIKSLNVKMNLRDHEYWDLESDSYLDSYFDYIIRDTNGIGGDISAEADLVNAINNSFNEELGFVKYTLRCDLIYISH